MTKFNVNGGVSLVGEVEISGSKNVSMPILIACILLDNKSFCGRITFANITFCNDVCIVLQILRSLGLCFDVEYKDGKTYLHLRFDCGMENINSDITKAAVSKLIRTSIVFMGPLVARYGYVKIPMPGGCKIGERKIDIHLDIAKQFGCELKYGEDYLEIKLKDKPKVIDYEMRFSSVGASHNAIMIACLASGKTTIKNIAIDPEVSHLVHFLQICGADINFNYDAKEVVINGSNGDAIMPSKNFAEQNCYYEPQKVKPHGIVTKQSVVDGAMQKNNHNFFNTNILHLSSDRIEAGTFVVAAAITKSKITLKNCGMYLFDGMLESLNKIGIKIEQANEQERCTVSLKNNVVNFCDIKTDISPGFPTDMQPQITSLLCFANKHSVIEETLFENRFSHVKSLNEMGGDIIIDGSKITITPIKQFNSDDKTSFYGQDLRCTAAIILACLARPSNAISVVENIEQLERGYEFFERKLNKLGAKIKKVCL